MATVMRSRARKPLAAGDLSMGQTSRRHVDGSIAFDFRVGTFDSEGRSVSVSMDREEALDVAMFIARSFVEEMIPRQWHDPKKTRHEILRILADILEYEEVAK